MFQGSMVAIVTPMNPDGSIDELCLRDLVEWHITEGTQAIIVNGTTGESVTLTPEEQYRTLKLCIETANGRIPIMAGTGTNDTQVSLERTHAAKDAGADACMLVTPYYNKPPQNGLYEHFKYIADRAAIPLLLYNVPSRTQSDILPETVERLSHIKNIFGIKEATGSLERAHDIRQRTGNQFLILSGDDFTAIDLMLNGYAEGFISVTANILPRAMRRLSDLAQSKQKKAALQLNDSLMPLHKAIFIQSNPIGVKWALHEMGKIPPGIRLPLIPLESQFHDPVRHALNECLTSMAT